jgi:hypothetical protein
MVLTGVMVGDPPEYLAKQELYRRATGEAHGRCSLIH